MTVENGEVKTSLTDAGVLRLRGNGSLVPTEKIGGPGDRAVENRLLNGTATKKADVDRAEGATGWLVS